MQYNLKEYTFILAAGESQNLTVSGQTVTAMQSTYPFSIELDGGQARDIEQGQGYAFEQAYQQIRVRTVNAQTIKLVLGFGQVFDNRVVINETLKTKSAPHTQSAGGAVSVLATATLISAAAVGRAEVAIQPQDGDIYIGNSNGVTMANGLRVALGGSISITHDDDIYAIAAAAVDTRWLSESE